MPMKAQNLFIAIGAISFFTSINLAGAGSAIEEAGALSCVIDKWDEKEKEKGHKLVDYAGRCIAVPHDASTASYSEDCSGKYEYKPDGTWRGDGTCTRALKNGDKIFDTFEEGSHLKEYLYKTTGGTGKYQGATGEGTYTLDNLTDTLGAGRFKGKLMLP
jgi:hypothetical protein